MIAHKPHPHVRPTRPKRVGAMTIAAGFEFQGGILVCADRQFSGGSIKLFQTKFSELDIQNTPETVFLRSIFVMSGTDGYMQAAVESCEGALMDLAADADPAISISQSDVKNSLTDALVNFHKQHIFPHPNYGYMSGPSVSLIAAIRCADDQPYLLWTNETTVNFVGGYKCVGSGAEIATFAVSPLYKNNAIALEDLVLVSTHGLRVAKAYDPYCGGQSEFAVMFDDGRNSRIEQFEIATKEAYSESFEEILRDLFFATANLQNNKAYLNSVVGYLRKKVEIIRAEQRDEQQKRSRLLDALLDNRR
jgi:hypothetical protein